MKNVKNFDQFVNEGEKFSQPSMVDTSKDAKSASNLKMTDATRKRIINSVKDILDGKGIDKSEKNVDKYIKKICKELGFEFSEFYATNGKKLNAMLDTIKDYWNNQSPKNRFA